MFCGSALGTDVRFAEAAKQVGEALAAAGETLVVSGPPESLTWRS